MEIEDRIVLQDIHHLEIQPQGKCGVPEAPVAITVTEGSAVQGLFATEGPAVGI